MRNLYLYILLVLISVTTIFLLNKYVYTDEYTFYSLQEKFTTEQTKDILAKKEKVQWILFIETPLKIIFKTLLVAFLLLAGINLYEHKLRFGSVFYISLLAEIIFLLPPLIRLLWFGFFDYSSFDDIINFPTFSIFDMFEQSKLEGWLTYPLKTINVFELIYILLLSHLLSQDLRLKFTQSLGIILSSYGLGLALWVVIVSFVMVNLGM